MPKFLSMAVSGTGRCCNIGPRVRQVAFYSLVNEQALVESTVTQLIATHVRVALLNPSSSRARLLALACCTFVVDMTNANNADMWCTTSQLIHG